MRNKLALFLTAACCLGFLASCAKQEAPSESTDDRENPPTASGSAAEGNDAENTATNSSPLAQTLATVAQVTEVAQENIAALEDDPAQPEAVDPDPDANDQTEPAPEPATGDSDPAGTPPADAVPAETDIAPLADPVAIPPPDEPVDLAAEPDSPVTPSAPESGAEAEPGPEENRGPLILDHELPAAIQFLARMANLNIYIDPSLTFTNHIGTDGQPGPPIVSLRWENVRPQDALDEVLDIHNLTLLENPKTGISRVTRKPKDPPLVTSILQLKYSNTTNMMTLIKAMLVDPRSKVVPDNRTSQLILQTTERELDAVTNLVAQLDRPTRQILIEAQLLETAKNPRSIKGIDWSGTLEGQNVSFGNGSTTGSTITETPGAPVSTTLPSGRTITTTPRSSQRTQLTTALGFGGLSLNTARGLHPSTAFLNADGVRAVLSFLNTDNDTRVVATPRSVTAEGEEATLSVTRAFPIFEITPGSAQIPPTAKITYTNLGTILRVTPRIAADTNVVMKVVPEVSNIDSKDRQIINGNVNEANVYAIRKLETEVVIPSGNTLVMGGLISDTITKAYSKVPILGDIPGLGLLFRRDTKSRSKANLLIFVTPTIVQSSDFQKNPSSFLETARPVSQTDDDWSAWDSGKPYDFKTGGTRN